jgi:AcrR family transcriptional regulator
MGRTRLGLLTGAARAFAEHGLRRSTMQSVAVAAGVAKATLYNHFRTKDDVLVALVEQRVTELVATALAAAGLQEALEGAARTVATSAALRKVAKDEPAALAPLLRPSDARGWTLAREGAAAVLTAFRVAAGPEQVELVLRWFTSQLAWPAVDGAGPLIQALAGAVPVARAAEAAPVAEPPAGVGWPAGELPALQA